MIRSIPVIIIVTLCVAMGCEPHAKTTIRMVKSRKLGLSEAVTIGKAVKRFPHFNKVTWETRFPSENITTIIMRGRLTDDACANIRDRLHKRLDLFPGNGNESSEERETRKRLIEAYLSLEHIYLAIAFQVRHLETGDAVNIQSVTYEGDTRNGEIQGIYAPEGELARLYEQRDLTGPGVW